MSDDNFIELEESAEEKKPECKGLFFRCSISSYISKHKSIETRKSLRLLKTKSCPGCGNCERLLDYMKEDIDNVDDYIGDLQPFKIYEYVVKCSQSYEGDWDCESDFLLRNDL